MAARALGRLGRRVPPPPPPADDSLAARAAFFLKAAAAVYLVREHLLEFTVCVGPSMMPTLNPRGDVCLLEHPSAALGRLGRGDVVVARSPAHARHVVCKRVLALAGDEVELGGPGAATRLARRGAAVTTGDADARAERGELGGFGGGGGFGGAGGAPPSYASHAAGDPFGAPRRVRVPRGHVWLEGDNARNSTDSRAYGPVPAALLRGRVVARVWPPWEARWL